MIWSIIGTHPPQFDPAVQAKTTSFRHFAPSRTALRIWRSVTPLHWQTIIDSKASPEVADTRTPIGSIDHTIMKMKFKIIIAENFRFHGSSDLDEEGKPI